MDLRKANTTIKILLGGVVSVNCTKRETKDAQDHDSKFSDVRLSTNRKQLRRIERCTNFATEIESYKSVGFHSKQRSETKHKNNFQERTCVMTIIECRI